MGRRAVWIWTFEGSADGGPRSVRAWRGEARRRPAPWATGKDGVTSAGMGETAAEWAGADVRDPGSAGTLKVFIHRELSHRKWRAFTGNSPRATCTRSDRTPDTTLDRHPPRRRTHGENVMHSDQRTLFLSGGVQPASLGSVAACGNALGRKGPAAVSCTCRSDLASPRRPLLNHSCRSTLTMDIRGHRNTVC